MTKAKKRARKMADIARLAGVSESTVSRALSDSPLVNSQTRARIRALARKHGYAVNRRASSLRRRQTRTVAVLVPLTPAVHEHISDLFFLDLLGSIADALTDNGYDMLVSKATSKQDWDADFLHSGRADGIIAIGQAIHHDSINAVARRGAPIVVWGAVLAGQAYCSVGSDNFRGAHDAASHLLRLGRRRIVFLGDPTLPEISDRHAGYLAAHSEADVAPDPGLLIPTAFSPQSSQRALERLFERDAIRLDAVFAVSDELAFNAINLLHARGMRVPDDVAVVGYDDIRLAEYVHPALTTVRQNIVEGGQLLARKLLECFAGDAPDSTILPTELIVRESCGGRARAAVHR